MPRPGRLQRDSANARPHRPSPYGPIAIVSELARPLAPVADQGMVIDEGDAAQGLRKWRIELGGKRRFKLRILPAAELDPLRKPNTVRQATIYDFTARGLDLATQLTIDVPQAPLRQMTLKLDPGVQLVAAPNNTP